MEQTVSESAQSQSTLSRLVCGGCGLAWYGVAGAECPQCALQPVVPEGQPVAVPVQPAVSAREAALESALRALVARIRRVGGYADDADQLALWRAEQLLK